MCEILKGELAMVRRLPGLWFFSAALLVCSALPVGAQEWTRFRGPNGTGESECRTIPATWTAADYNWNVKLPGVGHSSPVLWGDRIFLLSGDPTDATRYTLCYDAQSGKKLWEKSFNSQTHNLHKQSSYASGTPAVDEKHVYFAWAAPQSITLLAMNHEGDVVWQRDLGSWGSQHGFGTSPVIYNEMVILSNSQEVGEDPACYMLAFDRTTGSEIWKTKLLSASTSYSVPAVLETKSGKPQLVSTNSGNGMFGLDPLTGKLLWSNPFFDKRTVSSPLVKGDLVFGSNGSGAGGNYLVAVHCDGEEAKLAYKISGTQAPYVPTSVARGDLLFLVSDSGIASCFDIKTGKSHWQKRIGGNYSSSLVRVYDKIYCSSMDGDVVVLAADKDFKELGRTSLGDGIRSTPAIANGRMYLRTFSHLMSIGGSESAAAGSN